MSTIIPDELTREDVAEATMSRFLTRMRVRREFDNERPWDTFAFALGSELSYESIRALVIETIVTDRSAHTHPAVVIREGECIENDQVTVYTLDFLSEPRHRSEYTDEDVHTASWRYATSSRAGSSRSGGCSIALRALMTSCGHPSTWQIRASPDRWAHDRIYW